MTDMPQMVALYNGMGGGSAAAIGAVELLRFSSEGRPPSMVTLVLGVTGALIGAVSLSGSVIAWAKLDGRMDKRYTFPGQQLFNAAVAIAAVVLGGIVVHSLGVPMIIAFFIAALALGVLMTLPIGGADMPVVISLYNALTGLAVAFEGFVLGNQALIIAGTMVGAAGTLLTQLMAKAMNRPIRGVLFSNFGGGGQMQEIGGAQKPIEAGDVAAMMAYAERVVIVPGYGLAVAQAQHKVWELTQKLIERGVKVKFAIHPVAGRMPGPHERAAGRGGRAVRPDRRHGRHQPRIRQHRCIAGDRRQRRGQSGGEDRSGLAHLRHADPRRRELEEHHRHQARKGHRFRRHRECAVLCRQHAHAVRRRRRHGGGAGERAQGAGQRRRPLDRRCAMPLAQGAQRPRADPRPRPDMRWTWAGLAQAGCRHAPHLRGGEAVGALEGTAERALAFESRVAR
jgi:hypothetical protein